MSNNTSTREAAAELLTNQPNGVVIGYSKEDSLNIRLTPFQYLSREQQIEQITKMYECGADFHELQIELYLVVHKLVPEVWRDFLVFFYN